MPWLPQDVISTDPSGSKSSWAGEGGCVAKRLSASLGILGQYGARKITLQLGQYVDFMEGVGGRCEQMSHGP